MFGALCASATQELFVKKLFPELEDEVYIKEGNKGSWKRQLIMGKRSGLFLSRANKSEVSVYIQCT